MRKEVLSLLFCLFIVFTGCNNGQTEEIVNEYNIIPLPNYLAPKDGRFYFTDEVKFILSDSSPEIKSIANDFIERLYLTSGIKLEFMETDTFDLPSICFNRKPGYEKEAYVLNINNGQINVNASEPAGFFYAIQTIYQLLPPAIYGDKKVKSAEWSIPSVEIRDSPRFEYRGLMLDVCRHFPSKEYVYKFIDMLAMHKMNIFHFHLADDQGWRIEIKKYPLLTEIGSKRKETLVDYYFTNYPQIFDGVPHSGYFTQEEIKEIVAYARERYITVIPEIEMPGHAVAALASYPHLSCKPDTVYDVEPKWGIFEHIFCPKEETFTFMEGVIDKIVELFPGPYIHVGGDECPKKAWQRCDHCQGLIKKLGLKDDKKPNPVDGLKHTKEEKLQSYFISRMEKYINSKGRKIIGWDEILEGGLAPNATVMSWRGIKGGMNAAKAGHNAIMTPGQYAYLDYYQEDPELAPVTIGGYNTLKKTYSYNPVPNDADELVKKHVIGIQGNVWAEYMQNDERRDYQAFPRAIALAESAWTKDENKDWKDFCQRMVSEFHRLDVLDVKACRHFFDVNIYTSVDEDKDLKIVLETFYPDAEIRFTTDGTPPTIASQLYEAPFAWKGIINLQAAAFINNKMLGKITSGTRYNNLISGRPFASEPSMGWIKGDVYEEDEILGTHHKTFALTNGRRGNTSSFSPWTSFILRDKKTDELTITVNLEQPTSIESVVFGSLHNPAYFTLAPSSATIEVSMDGKKYTKVSEESFSRTLPDKGRAVFTDTLNFDKVEAMYFKIRFKSGGPLRNGIDCRKEGNSEFIQSNIFLDEIEIY